MDDSRLGSIELDYEDDQPEESNTGPAEGSDYEQSDDGLHIPEQLRTTGVVHDIIRGVQNDEPIARTSNEAQFTRDENEVIKVGYCPLQRYNLIRFAATLHGCNPNGTYSASCNGT